MAADYITKEDWYKFYTPENLKLLENIRQLSHGKVEIEVHAGQPSMLVVLWKKIRLQRRIRNKNDKNTKQLPVISG